MTAEVPSIFETAQTESQELAMPAGGLWRGHVLYALDALGVSQAVWTRYATCCTKSAILKHQETGRVKLGLETCGSRLCPNCQRRYRLKVTERIENLLGRVAKNAWRFITLTVPHSDLELADQLDHIQQSFRRLRQTQIWQQTQLLGVAVFEMTFNSESKRWHPHLHILSRGLYLPQKKLSAAWSRCSRGAKIVDIRKVRSGSEAASYVSKYLGKNPSILNEPNAAALMTQFVRALRHRKMLIPFGVKVEAERDEEPSPIPRAEKPWTNIGTYEHWLQRARANDLEARRIISEVIQPYVWRKIGEQTTIPDPGG